MMKRVWMMYGPRVNCCLIEMYRAMYPAHITIREPDQPCELKGGRQQDEKLTQPPDREREKVPGPELPQLNRMVKPTEPKKRSESKCGALAWVNSSPVAQILAVRGEWHREENR